jgi:hypothetical protein
MRHAVVVAISLSCACSFDASGNGTPQETLGTMQTTGGEPWVSSSSGEIDPDVDSGSLATTVHSARPRLYIDGVLASEVEDGDPIATGSSNPLAIGDNSPGFDQALAGAISGVRIWSVPRTVTQLCEAAGDLCS